MANMISNFQDRVKTSSNALALLALKALTGAYIGLTLALVGDEIIQYGWFSFTLVIIATMATLLKVTKSWTWVNLLIFNLFCVLVGLLLRMYILIAPG
jgi:hypothetical protein